MKKICTLTFLFWIYSFSFADTIVLQYTEANCKKVNGFGGDTASNIAHVWEIPLASVKFVKTKWKDRRCGFIFDTAIWHSPNFVDTLHNAI
jgi:hypothetical protein